MNDFVARWIDTDVDPRGRRAVAGLPALGCRSIVYHSQIDSTNSAALDDLRGGRLTPELLPRIYLADRQTAGRGRHGNRWLSDDATLTFSLLIDLPPPQPIRPPHGVWAHLPLAVGVAIARAIEHHLAPHRAGLKWPNDVYLDGCKVAGILCETLQAAGGPAAVVIGVGVNVAAAPVLDPAAAAVPATSLAAASGRPVTRYEVLPWIVESLLDTLDELFRPGGAAGVLDAFRSRCVLSGKTIRIAGRTDALCGGVADDGGLIVTTGQERSTLHSGDVRQIR